MKRVIDLMKAAGVSRRTISAYQDAGLLPAPHLAPDAESGRGMVGYWPDDALVVVQRIRAMQRRGLSLDQIRAEFFAQRTNWGAASFRAKRRFKLLSETVVQPTEPEREIKARMGGQLDRFTGLSVIECHLFASLIELGLNSVLALNIARGAIESPFLPWAIELLLVASQNPVLVVTGFNEKSEPRMHIGQDFLVSHEVSATVNGLILSASGSDRLPSAARVGVLALPLTWVIASALERCGATVSGSYLPNVMPANAARVRLKDSILQRDFRLISMAGDSPFGPLIPTFTEHAGTVSGSSERPHPPKQRGARRKPA